MSTVTTMSTKQSETYVVGEFRPLGPLSNFTGDEFIIMRHGETIEEAFPDWVVRSKLDEDSYSPFDVNCPIELARRPEMRQSYELDPPLSEIAKITVKMTARELCDRKFYPSVILCTPDFASVETAQLIKKYMGDKCGNIRIEPELSTLHKYGHVFFGKNQFQELGYGVDCQTLPLAAISGKASVPDLMARVKRAFYELTGKIDNALLVLDPFAMRIIASIFYPIKIGVSSSVEIERSISTSNFPPLSNLAAFKLGKSGIKNNFRELVDSLVSFFTREPKARGFLNSRSMNIITNKPFSRKFGRWKILLALTFSVSFGQLSAIRGAKFLNENKLFTYIEDES